MMRVSFDSTMTTRNHSRSIQLIQVFATRFVLEVLGAAGAIWGPAEALGLRTSQNLWFWRPLVLAVGCIFFLRWCSQLYESLLEMARLEQTEDHFGNEEDVPDDNLSLQEEQRVDQTIVIASSSEDTNDSPTSQSDGTEHFDDETLELVKDGRRRKRKRYGRL